MYESQFGISGLPFQLSPDPSFYFDSRAHHDAMAELRRGVAERARCMVVSGEIGAGKTTLVRTLLGELPPDGVAVAHIVSTQLDAAELIAATSIGFGIPPAGATAEDRLEQLLAFLRDTRDAGRHAVLIVDEAQNLRPQALQPLVRIFSEHRSENLRFQLCLVGQPELRAMLQRADMHDMRALITVSCHLGPISREETRSYIEHRLRKVGWSGKPSFQPDAFDAVFEASGGIPRRINLLCNRVMLACFLVSESRIDAAAVRQAARDLLSELGDAEASREPDATSPAAAALHGGTAGGAPARRGVERPVQAGPLLCVAAGLADHLKAAALMRAFRLHSNLPTAGLVRAHANDALERGRALFAGLDIDAVTIPLALAERDCDAQDMNVAFEGVLGRTPFGAVIVFDATPCSLACARAAREHGVPVIHVGAGRREQLPGAQADAGRQIDELSDLLYTSDAEASRALAEEGVPAERVHCVGNLVVDAIEMALRVPMVTSPAGTLPVPLASRPIGRNGYGVVAIHRESHLRDAAVMQQFMSILADVNRDLFLVWLGDADSLRQHPSTGQAQPFGDRALVLPAQPYPDYLILLREATCILTDAWTVQEEATTLGVPCLTLGSHPASPLTVSVGSNVVVGTSRTLATRVVWECIFNGGKRGRVPPLWDGKAASRIASYLRAWLPGRSRDEVDRVARTAGAVRR